jgi:riboflavin synthase
VFTGIVEEVGEVVAVEHRAELARIGVRGPLVVSDARHGDSIAVNGVCLTVVSVSDDTFTVDVVQETLRRSSLAKVQVGDRVNLERAAAVGQRLGGHVVQGHVDGTGVLLSRAESGLTRFALPLDLARYVVPKGSITVDGVSLTVVEVGEEEFSVALIPTTLADTTLGSRVSGDPVNLEVDVLAKYVERLAVPYLAGSTTARSEDNGGRSEEGR